MTVTTDNTAVANRAKAQIAKEEQDRQVQRFVNAYRYFNGHLERIDDKLAEVQAERVSVLKRIETLDSGSLPQYISTDTDYLYGNQKTYRAATGEVFDVNFDLLSQKG